MKWRSRTQRVSTFLPAIQRIAAEKILQQSNEASRFGRNCAFARPRRDLVLFAIAFAGQFFFAIWAWRCSQFKRCAQRTNIKYPRTFVSYDIRCVLSMRCGFEIMDKMDFPPTLVSTPEKLNSFSATCHLECW